MTFNGPAIRTIRTIRGMKQVELARAAGMSQGHLANVERAHDTLNVRHAHLIAHALGVTDLRALLGPDEMPDAEIAVGA